MDNQQFTELINRCKRLKHRFRGIFPAKLAYRSILKRDKTFMIVNASNSDLPGTHWLLFAQAGGHFSLHILMNKDYTIIYMFTKT